MYCIISTVMSGILIENYSEKFLFLAFHTITPLIFTYIEYILILGNSHKYFSGDQCCLYTNSSIMHFYTEVFWVQHCSERSSAYFTLSNISRFILRGKAGKNSEDQNYSWLFANVGKRKYLWEFANHVRKTMCLSQ